MWARSCERSSQYLSMFCQRQNGWQIEIRSSESAMIILDPSTPTCVRRRLVDNGHEERAVMLEVGHQRNADERCPRA